MIAPQDMELFTMVDDVDAAFAQLEKGLTKYYLEPDKDKETPAIAKSRI
jgi:hypothetical protein